MIKKLTLADQAYFVLRDMILSGELKPGETLVQDQLAEKLGISRTPILHALKLLESENLIIGNNNHRVSVRQFTLEEMIVLFEMRESLESLACRYLAPLVTKNEVTQFKEDFTQAYQKRDSKEYRRVDNAFHLFVAEECPYLDLKTTLIRSGFMTKCLIKGLIRPPEETYQEHMEILDRFEMHDSSGVEEKMKIHIQKTVKRLKEMQSSNIENWRDEDEL